MRIFTHGFFISLKNSEFYIDLGNHGSCGLDPEIFVVFPASEVIFLVLKLGNVLAMMPTWEIGSGVDALKCRACLPSRAVDKLPFECHFSA